MTNFEMLRKRLHAKAGIILEPKEKFLTYEELARSEWSPRFEQLMRNRLIMGALRYGRLGAKRKASYSRTAGIRKRLEQYELSGNLEYLVDIANLALVEFVESTHPRKHWNDVHGDHVCAHVAT